MGQFGAADIAIDDVAEQLPESRGGRMDL